MSKGFSPKPGQVDYTNARWAPVINCLVRHKDRILVVRRSEVLNFYPGYWNGVSGFLDDKKSLREKVEHEIEEEVGIPGNMIDSVLLGEIFHQEESKYGKTWIVHPVLVDVLTDEVTLDWEAKEYKWISPKEAEGLNLLPGFEKVLEKLSQFF